MRHIFLAEGPIFDNARQLFSRLSVIFSLFHCWPGLGTIETGF